MRQIEYGHFIQPVVFSDKVIADIDFTFEVGAQWDVPAVKILF